MEVDQGFGVSSHSLKLDPLLGSAKAEISPGQQLLNPFQKRLSKSQQVQIYLLHWESQVKFTVGEQD